MKKNSVEGKHLEQRVIDNRSCHLRDRDISVRSALTYFRKLTRNIKRKIISQKGKDEIHRNVLEMQKMLEDALYHASMASRHYPKKELSAEERVISDFLLTFNAACSNIKYLISHSSQLQKLAENKEDHSKQFQDYIQNMRLLDEDSLLKFIEQLKKRIHFFNKTMKIQK